MYQLPRIHSLSIYPVKSCAAISLATAYVARRGLMSGAILDRGWVVVDANGVLVSQRDKPAMARIRTELIHDDNGVAAKIQLSFDSMQSIILDPATVGHETLPIKIHGKGTSGHLASAKLSQWFSDILGEHVHLIYQKDEDVRICDQRFAVAPDDSVSFADGFPYLITTLTNLQKLNNYLDNPVPMNRFRPNIVIETDGVDNEYAWREIVVGEVGFRLVKPCTRCVMTTIDQITGEKMGKDPLATLAKNNFLSDMIGETRVQGAVFGENAIPTASGIIAVSDEVRVTDTKPEYNFRKSAS